MTYGSCSGEGWSELQLYELAKVCTLHTYRKQRIRIVSEHASLLFPQMAGAVDMAGTSSPVPF